MIYDIIGDIHGQADKLIGLLTQLGYSLVQNKDGTSYYHPPKGHKALFIGDLIDRGTQELKTLQTVFAMIDAGVADSIMGNHEYNALAYATLDLKNDKNYLRPHTKRNTAQHEAFLAEIPFGSTEHKYWLKRLYELPLWLETEHACFVHACWDVNSMQKLQQPHNKWVDGNNCLTAKGLQATGQKNSVAYNALERVLKGVETPLPDGMYMTDKDGTKRRNVRVKWWLDNLNNRPIHEVARAPKSGLAQIPQDAMTDPIDFTLKTTKPIFIGHYWFNGTPEPLTKQVVCTDYSAAIDSGFLTCYQFDTAKPLPLSKDNFVQFDHLV